MLMLSLVAIKATMSVIVIVGLLVLAFLAIVPLLGYLEDNVSGFGLIPWIPTVIIICLTLLYLIVEIGLTNFNYISSYQVLTIPVAIGTCITFAIVVPAIQREWMIPKVSNMIGIWMLAVTIITVIISLIHRLDQELSWLPQVI